VSRPPEKMRSTATADPRRIDQTGRYRYKVGIPGMASISLAHRDILGNCARRPDHHWTGSQVVKFSCGCLRNPQIRLYRFELTFCTARGSQPFEGIRSVMSLELAETEEGQALS
jgi:hypothetical protein